MNEPFALPILYGAPDSGHSYKVRLALMLAEHPHTYRAVDLALPRGQRGPAFEAASRWGEVPVWLEDGVAHAQSNAILLHLGTRHGLLGGERAAVREWLFWEANRIGLSVPNLRHALRWAPQPEPVLAWLRRRAESDLDTLEQTLASQPWLLGEAAHAAIDPRCAGPSLADVACAAYLY